MSSSVKKAALKTVNRRRKSQLPCHRCIVIRFFLMAVACIALMQFLAPQIFIILHGFDTLTLALLFLGGFGAIAILKSVVSYFAVHTDDE